jgi:GNAT superfamily N-acetyltransferase
MDKKDHFKIREAKINDAPIIYDFIVKLAIYEKMEDQVKATIKSVEESLFIRKDAHVILAEENDQAIGFALYFKTYSTFLGKANYYLEDLYINEDKRGKGYGKKILSHLASIAYEDQAERLEWVCLDWNKPSIAFYQKIGALPLEDWTVYRLSGTALKDFAKKEKS